MPSKFVQSPDGLWWVDRGPGTDDHLAFTGHEAALGPWIKLLADPSRAYVAVGAHVGTWTVRIAAADFAKSVVAIEANYLTADALRMNVEKNELSSKVTIVQAPIWSANGKLVYLMDVNDKPSGGSTRVVESELPWPTGLETMTLDTCLFSVLKSEEHAGLLQLDVEGAEAHVLNGAERILSEHRPNLIIELHEGHPGTDPKLREQVYSALDKHDYHYVSISPYITSEYLMCRPQESVEDY